MNVLFFFLCFCWYKRSKESDRAKKRSRSREVCMVLLYLYTPLNILFQRRECECAPLPFMLEWLFNVKGGKDCTLTDLLIMVCGDGTLVLSWVPSKMLETSSDHYGTSLVVVDVLYIERVLVQYSLFLKFFVRTRLKYFAICFLDSEPTPTQQEKLAKPVCL